MTLNKESVDLIKSFEGLRLKAYQDSVGVWTIGYGHTSAAGSPVVKSGLIISEAEATSILENDLKKYENSVKKYVKVDLNDNQYGALVSFVYNLGEGNFSKSTLLKKLNAKDFTGAANEFAKWNKAGGKVLAGLTRRRAAEKALFLKPVLIDTQSPVHNDYEVPSTMTPSSPSKASTSLLEVIINILMKLFGGK